MIIENIVNNDTVASLKDINQMSIPDAAKAYAAMGFKLIAVEPKNKKPVGNNWQKEESCRPAEYWRTYPEYNIGCVAKWNNLLVVDIDSKPDFKILCNALEAVLKQDTGVDQPFWLSTTCGITSHTPDHGKLVFRVPEGVEGLEYRKVAWKHWVTEKQKDGTEKPVPKTFGVVEFRCDKQQDVLPPSIHPSGSKYEWVGEGDTIIDASADLIRLIQHWEQYQEIIDTANPDYEEGLLRKVTSKNVASKKSVPVNKSAFTPVGLKPEHFAEWNKRFSAVDICLRNGYEQIGDRLRPIGSTHEAGVQIQDDGKVYSHHANDPLNDGYPHDAYDCLKILECDNDPTKAVGRVLVDLGIDCPGKNNETTELIESVIEEFSQKHMEMFLSDYHKMHHDDDIVAKLILCQRINPLIEESTSICIQVIGESQNGKTHAVDSMIPLVGYLCGKTKPHKNKKGEIEDGIEFQNQAIFSASFTDKAIYRIGNFVADGTILRIDDVEINDAFADIFKGSFKRGVGNTRVCTNSLDTSKADVLECPKNLQFIISGVQPWIVDEQTKNRTLFITIPSSPERDAEINKLRKDRRSGKITKIDTEKYTVLWDEISKYQYTVNVDDIWDRIQMPKDHMNRENDTLITIVASLTVLNHWERGKTDYVASIEDLKEAVDLFNQTIDETDEFDFTGMRQKLRGYAHVMMDVNSGEYTIDELYNIFRKHGLKPVKGCIKYDLIGRNMRGKFQTGLVHHLPGLEKIDITKQETVGDGVRTTETEKTVKFRWTQPESKGNLMVIIKSNVKSDDATETKIETETTSQKNEWLPMTYDGGQTGVLTTFSGYMKNCSSYTPNPASGTGVIRLTEDQEDMIGKYAVNADDRIEAIKCVKNGHLTFEDALRAGNEFVTCHS